MLVKANALLGVQSFNFQALLGGTLLLKVCFHDKWQRELPLVG